MDWLRKLGRRGAKLAVLGLYAVCFLVIFGAYLFLMGIFGAAGVVID